jgi:glycosyltransferase involved in cell wall biosynthesis
MGLLVPSGDPKILADALERLVSSSSEELQTMGQLLRKKVESEYGKEAFLSSYLNLLSTE